LGRTASSTDGQAAPAGALAAVLKRDRAIVAASLAILVALAWLYLFRISAGMADMREPAGMAGMDMPGMADMDMPGTPAAPPQSAVFPAAALMWFVMMVGMMAPAAAPLILIFAAVERKGRPARRPFGRVGLFTAGYLLLWAAFSLAAAASQIALARAGLFSAELALHSAALAGGVFVLAGLYELSPLKNRCLAHCRSPLEWLSLHHRSGPAGALAMGVEHGAFCVGCCWLLMLLLFAVGVMNLLFVAALAAIVLAQKLLPGGKVLARVGGVALIACGIALIAQPLVAA
jgi:predicted metal-binding membrane protein